VWVSALSYGDALTYIRPKLEKYCPTGSRFIRWKAQDRGQILLPNGGKVLSLSADAGREKYQGAAVSLVILDEEHPRDIFDECMLRTVDNRGKVVLTMTPLKGITWPFDCFFENPKPGYHTYSISGLDNPHVSSVKLRKAIAHMSMEAQRSRLYGDFVNQQGLVYQEFNRETHIVEPFAIPNSWPRYRAIDFGTRNPFACLWFAWDVQDDVLHVYREYYATERTTTENGRHILNNSGTERYDWTVADPESRDGRLTLSREWGIETKAAPKHIGVTETINWVKERLALDIEGRPHLVVHKNCSNLIKEFRLYRWSDGRGKDKPIKKHDHALDALRYQIAFHKRYLMHQ
jgi:phage terminase large subunit-like protein